MLLAVGCWWCGHRSSSSSVAWLGRAAGLITPKASFAAHNTVTAPHTTHCFLFAFSLVFVNKRTKGKFNKDVMLTLLELTSVGWWEAVGGLYVQQQRILDWSRAGHRLVEPGQDGHFTVLGRQPTTGQLQLGAGQHADCGGGAVHWTVALSGGCGAESSDTEMISIWLTVVN